MTEPAVAEDDPRSPEVVQLLETHLRMMQRVSPPGHVHALDLDGLLVPEVTFYSARSDGDLLGVGALKLLDDDRAEIKSMHTAAIARGRGIGRLLVEHIIAAARAAGVMWLGLETGTQPEFEPARALYASYGFATCEPFAAYTVNPYSTCMSLDLAVN